MPTPHNSAAPSDFAKTVLMPGDPLRAKFIAETYLENAKLVNNVRGIQGYTGTYKGTPVSVMASGMGIPSIAIYSQELYSFYGVENIIRIGSAGAIQQNIKVRDIVIGQAASTDSAFARQYSLPGSFAPIADFTLLRAAVECAEQKGYPFHVGNLLSSDAFYSYDTSAVSRWSSMGIMAIEMEAAGLYCVAAREKKRALSICTVSNHILTGEDTTHDERRTTLTQMIEIALEIAVKMENEK